MEGYALRPPLLTGVAAIVTPPAGPSHRADLDRLLQALEPIARRQELVREIPLVARVGDRLGHRVVVQLLRIVDLLAPRNPARVVVADVLMVVADRADDVSLH